MSADLFAEFNSPPNSTPPPAQPNNGFGQPPQQQTHNQGRTHDPFNFTVGNNAASPSQPAPQWSSLQSTSNSMSDWHQSSHVSQPTNTVPQQGDDDDGWGDFEVANTTVPATAPTPAPALPKVNTQPPAPITSGWDSYSTFNSRSTQINNHAAQAPATDLMGGGFVDFGGLGSQAVQNSQPSWSQPESNKRVSMQAAPSDPNVLFDADDFELQDGGDEDDEFDEFGDFEAVAPGPRPKQAPPATAQLASSLDLLGLDDPPIPSLQRETKSQAKPEVKKEETRASNASLSFGAMSSNKPQSPSAASYQSPTAPSTGLDSKRSALAPSHKPKSSSISVASTKKAPITKVAPTKAKATANEDEWGAWDDFSGANGSNNNDQKSEKAAVTENWDWDAADDNKPTTAKADDNSPPPVNVPPPSILLSAFPELFNTGHALFKPVAGQTTSIKQQVLSNPRTVQSLQGYVLLAATAARVIAGRKHRWHRDKILAKSMSISAAGSKGMKLAGVDKTQSAREDREAADVVAAWREHVGRLRSAVAAANSTGKANLKVPELTENAQVQTAKMVPTAPKACIICGLKREERVAKVDVDVEDSFGEWWVDHWGHRACKNFWIEHEQQLRQR